MVKPSEMLMIADESSFKHYIFYGYSKLPQEEWHSKKDRDGGYGVYDLSKIDYEHAKISTYGKTCCYNYGLAIQTICFGKINANFVAKLLDSYFKVVGISHEDDTLYIRLILK